ncbi:MAG: 6-bladed beta-propeller, partial [Anaerolineae bacterium]|nr:6-bladed beta-propeller [Phycisphaerae bacterium]
GQLVAIALIRLYNHPQTVWLYQSALPVMMAYVARFGWIVLLAAGATFTAPWRSLRDLAAVDGASSFAAARYVVWPLAWPLLGASALFVTALSLSEVPATVLLAPQQPPMLVPLLMTWVHMLRYDPMIEASLLSAGIIVAIGVVAVGLWILGRRKSQITNHKSQRSSNAKTSNLKSTPTRAFFSFGFWNFFVICLLSFGASALSGCDARSSAKAVWLDTGTGPGQVVYPRAICYSPGDDTFFIVDRSAHVQQIDRAGNCLMDWHMPQSQQGKPVGLSIGPDGNLYVPDTHYHRVIVYKTNGEKIREFGGKGSEPGQFIYPTDIAFDSRGYMFIAEYGDNDRIQVFDASGKFAYRFGAFGDRDGEFSRPQSIVIENDYLYVTDACNHRIVVFKTDGTFVRNMGKVGSGPGEYRFPYGLDIDSDGDLIVCEFGNNRVQKIDKQTGKRKAIWGGPGRETGQLAYPWGVAVDKDDRVIAVDAGNNRLQVFRF